jgi:5'-nucleotidase
VADGGAPPWVLLTNDDGVDSPALPPLLRELSAIARVRAVVPAAECSWAGKVMSRFAVLDAVPRGDGAQVYSVNGYPADCANLGIHSLFDTPPGLVVSGVNLGTNAGLAFLLSSGTVAAAVEAALAGVPAAAFSAQLDADDFGRWRRERRLGAGARAQLETSAVISRQIVAELLRGGLPGDASLLTVNLPVGVRLDSPRRLARLTVTDYGPFFARDGQGRFAHHYSGLRTRAPAPDGDLAVLARGEVALTPIRLSLDAAVCAADRSRFEGADGCRPGSRAADP